MLLSAAVYLLSYLHIDEHPFTSLNPTLLYSLYEMLFLFVSKENTAFSNRLKNSFIYDDEEMYKQVVGMTE